MFSCICRTRDITAEFIQRRIDSDTHYLFLLKLKKTISYSYNPNSFVNTGSSAMLFDMGVRVGVEKQGNGDRKWLFIECDGGIYVILEKLVLLFSVEVAKLSPI